MKLYKFILLLNIFSVKLLCGYNVGLCVMATGKYIDFVKPLVNSAHKYFCKNHKVTYFIFTEGQTPQEDSVVKVEQHKLGWPYDTMMRFEVFYKHKELLSKMDYLFCVDADMLFVNDVGDEILSYRVATQSPGFYGKTREELSRLGSYEEKNPESLAYMAPDEGEQYFAGGFYGGSAEEFLHMAYTNSSNIKKDLEKNIIATWHDESHLNRYFYDNKPTLILNPSYCYPERWSLPFDKKLLALDKNHAEMRE